MDQSNFEVLEYIKSAYKNPFKALSNVYVTKPRTSRSASVSWWAFKKRSFLIVHKERKKVTKNLCDEYNYSCLFNFNKIRSTCEILT